jgi:formylglycine-generating enzyme required for sulfatase activity
MLQLQPRREKPPPPVTDLPPPPPPMSGETALPDATQPVDSVKLKAVLDGRPVKESPEEVRANREETAVIDSGLFLKSIDDDVDTRAVQETVAPPDEGRSSMTWVIVVLLAILGVGLGAGGGYYGIQKQKAAAEETRRAAEELKRQADEKARKDAEDAAKAAQGALTPEQRAAEEKALADKAAADKALADKLSAEKLAQEKAAADKAAQDKAASDKAAADKTAADKAAAAEKFEKEKAAADKLAQEKEKAAAEKAKALADKAAAEKAAKEKKPVEVAAVTASATKAAGDGPCPEGMRAIAGGPFRMGTAADDPMRGFDEKALSTVPVSPYCIDVFEYPNKRGAAPMASVTHQDAARLCESQGKRLCSESEWEKACKGPGGAKWPYGATFDAAACNTEDDAGDSRSLASAGKFGKCKSAYGISDLSGNVAEWTQEKFIKGGSFASGDYAVRCSARKNGTSFAKSSEVGFRCCADQR